MRGGGTGIDCPMARFSTLYKSMASLAAAPEPPLHPTTVPDVFLPPGAQKISQKPPAAQSAKPLVSPSTPSPKTQPQAGSRLDVPLQKQRKNRLCWAAVAASLDDYYGEGPVKQSMLVGEPGGNQSRSMTVTLDRLKRLQRVQEGAATFNDIQREICGSGLSWLASVSRAAIMRSSSSAGTSSTAASTFGSQTPRMAPRGRGTTKSSERTAAFVGTARTSLNEERIQASEKTFTSRSPEAQRCAGCERAC